MKNILRNLRLLDSLTVELDIEKNEFVKILRRNIDEKQSDFLDAFSSSNNNYKGFVTQNGFEIKRTRRFFDMNTNFATATGTFKQKDNKLIIDTEISAYQKRLVVMFFILIGFYSIFFIRFLTSDNVNDIDSLFVIPFLIIHALFMFGIPYFMLRKSINRMKYELERDFYFMIKK